MRLRLGLIRLYGHDDRIMFMTEEGFDIFCIGLNCDSPLVDGYESKKWAVAI